MTRLKCICTQDLGALVFLDQLLDRLTVAIGKHQVSQANRRGPNAESLLRLRRRIGTESLWICPQCLLKALGEKMVFLVPLLSDHRLNGTAKLGIVPLLRGAN